MRLLNLSDSDATDEIISVAAETLANSEFLFEEGDAHVLSGAEEGGYGWVSVNVIEGAVLPGSGMQYFNLMI